MPQPPLWRRVSRPAPAALPESPLPLAGDRHMPRAYRRSGARRRAPLVLCPLCPQQRRALHRGKYHRRACARPRREILRHHPRPRHSTPPSCRRPLAHRSQMRHHPRQCAADTHSHGLPHGPLWHPRLLCRRRHYRHTLGRPQLAPFPAACHGLGTVHRRRCLDIGKRTFGLSDSYRPRHLRSRRRHRPRTCHASGAGTDARRNRPRNGLRTRTYQKPLRGHHPIRKHEPHRPWRQPRQSRLPRRDPRHTHRRLSLAHRRRHRRRGPSHLHRPRPRHRALPPEISVTNVTKNVTKLIIPLHFSHASGLRIMP